MTESAIVNDNIHDAGTQENQVKTLKNYKIFGYAAILMFLVEGVLAFFFFFKPYLIRPVYDKVNELLDMNVKGKIVFFKDIFISDADRKASGVTEIALSDAVMNIIFLYLIFTILPIVFAYLHTKAQTHTNTFFTILFTLKTLVYTIPFLVPFAVFEIKVKNLQLFSGIMLPICIFFLGYFFLKKIANSAEEQFYTDEQIAAYKKRFKLGIIFFIGAAIFTVLHSLTAQLDLMAVHITNDDAIIDYSIFLGWNETGVIQAFALIFILAGFMVSILAFIYGQDWGIFFIASFGLGFCVSDGLAVVTRILNTKGFGTNTIILIAMALVSLGIAVFALRLISGSTKKDVRPENDSEKRANTIIKIGSLSYLAAVVLAMVSFVLVNKVAWGVLDFVYVGVALSAALTALLSIKSGYDWGHKYVLFSSVVFMALSISPLINTIITEGQKYKAFSVPLQFVSIAIYIGITIVFIAQWKNISDYLYKKRY